MNIYVGNLHFKATEEDVRSIFEEYGEVTSVKIVNDRETGRSKGFAFVEMADDADGNQSIEALNDAEFMGRPLVVNEARPREERKDRGDRTFKKTYGSNDSSRERRTYDKGGYNKGGGDFKKKSY